MTDSSNTPKKRPNGYGTVYLRSDGRWCAQFKERDSLEHIKTRSLYARTGEDIWRKLHDALPDDEKGLVARLRQRRTELKDKANPHVYVIQCEHGGPIKIGIAHSVRARLADIQSCCPYPLRLLHVIEHGGLDTERRLHRTLQGFRLHGEWFKDHPMVHRQISKMQDLHKRAS